MPTIKIRTISESGIEVIIYKITSMIRGTNLEGLPTYKLSDGGHVNVIDVNTFEVLETSEKLKRIN